MYIAGGITLTALIAMILVLCLSKGSYAARGEFVPPTFDREAAQGMPRVADDLDYMECYQDGMDFRFWACGNVKMDGRNATVYLTNPESNTVWMKVRILDAEGTVLGESGLIKPGEYVKSVMLSAQLPVGTPIRLKIMTYEPDTYYSAGAVALNTRVGG